MPCLIKALTRSAIKKTTKKTNNKIRKKQNFTVKTQYLDLKAPCKNLRMQSDKTLATQIYSFFTTQQMGFFLNGTRSQKLLAYIGIILVNV